MPTPEVIDRLRALHDQAEREQHAALDPVRKQLATIVIEPHETAHYNSLSERLQAAYKKLELEHPALASAVQAAMNALNAAGI